MSRFENMIRVTPKGLYCPAGDFYIDPWRGVDRAVITHGHSDHARPGSLSYVTAADGVEILRTRLGRGRAITGMKYGEQRRIGDVTVSLHPAGHILGSAQVRIDCGGAIVVVSGDYKREADRTCTPFEVVRCQLFITECTFGLPIYRWPNPADEAARINNWFAANRRARRPSMLHAYSLGKAQRLLANIDATIGPIHVHHQIAEMCKAYEAVGVHLPVHYDLHDETLFARDAAPMILCPPTGDISEQWLEQINPVIGTASGWNVVRGGRWGGSDAFVVSDHVDWDGLWQTIQDTGAERIGVTHGQVGVCRRRLRELGYQAEIFPTCFGDGHVEGGEKSVTHSAPDSESLPLLDGLDDARHCAPEAS